MIFLRLFTHPLGHDDPHPVALEPTNQGHADPRVAARRFADDRIGLQPAVALGVFDHRAGNTILDAATRIKKLGLGKNVLALQAEQGVFPIRVRILSVSIATAGEMDWGA